jgi:ABC-2 type transport system permease protein
MSENIINYKKILVLFKKEFRFFFFSPIAYIFICVFLIFAGWVFFSQFFLFNQAEMRNFFELLPYFLAFIIPAITMGQFSEEFSVGSYEMISTTSVSLMDIILAKFLAACAFMFIALIPTFIYPVSIAFIGDLDFGPVIGGYFGSVLLIGAFAAIGIFSSALTKNQIMSLIISIAICVPLTFILFMDRYLPPVFSGIIDNFSAAARFENIAKGVIDLSDVLYFLSLILIALYSTKLVLDRKK